ncbi:GNAT family acetyltransferase [Hungatella sp. L12]|uniref:GNAT family acetyltransferase n=1 Tax=Hungatella hominis TaxID=2763050 RepID=A0ABR7HDC4_9FIRM|nr:GNAT family acetyltransferase [Hungatella hominis]MBC5711175.1 GNAT family acetyltransferase [Hungatella hominis]
MNRTDELFFEMIVTYQRHAQAVRNAKYQETREMAEILLNMDISAMWFLTQRTPDTRSRLV